ncbi:Pyrophosphate--fructose 6-phosphate 1-phosphotransferase subunit beta 2, partial [Durusdinium trenchii]
AIPTPKKVKPPPLPEPQPPPLSSQVPWSTQLKAADPDWYDEDDAGYDSSDSFPEAGELPEEEVSATAAAPPTSTAPAALAAPGTAPAAKVAPVTPAAAPPKATEKPKAPAPKKAKAVKPKSPKAAAPKPKVVLREPKGRAQGVSAVDGVTDDVFSSPIHRREAVAHPQDAPDPQGIRVLQTGGGMEMIQQDPEVLSEPESQDSVDSISGEIARSWDPTATDVPCAAGYAGGVRGSTEWEFGTKWYRVRYSYARDRAVGFSESWRPLKWSTEEWERRLLASGNLRHRVGIAKQKSDPRSQEYGTGPYLISSWKTCVFDYVLHFRQNFRH